MRLFPSPVGLVFEKERSRIGFPSGVCCIIQDVASSSSLVGSYSSQAYRLGYLHLGYPIECGACYPHCGALGRGARRPGWLPEQPLDPAHGMGERGAVGEAVRSTHPLVE